MVKLKQKFFHKPIFQGDFNFDPKWEQEEKNIDHKKYIDLLAACDPKAD